MTLSAPDAQWLQLHYQTPGRQCYATLSLNWNDHAPHPEEAIQQFFEGSMAGWDNWELEELAAAEPAPEVQRYVSRSGSQSFPSPQLAQRYPSVGNFIMVVGRQGQEALVQRVKGLMQAHASLDVQSISLPAAVDLAGLSDHRSYWRYGYPALMINDAAFLRNRNYHRPSDTIDTPNFVRIAQVVDGVLGAILAL